jgi:hypothetical protein
LAAWASADFLDDGTDLLLDDVLAKVLMGQTMCVKKVIIKKVAKGTVSYVMHEACDAQTLFHKWERGTVSLQDPVEGRIKVPREYPCEVHGPKHVLKPTVFCCRVNPTGTLKLIDRTKPLEP